VAPAFCERFLKKLSELTFSPFHFITFGKFALINSKKSEWTFLNAWYHFLSTSLHPFPVSLIPENSIAPKKSPNYSLNSLATSLHMNQAKIFVVSYKHLKCKLKGREVFSKAIILALLSFANYTRNYKLTGFLQFAIV
jgi:hypothetical protein